MERFVALLFAVATLACGENVFSPETAEIRGTYALRELEYRAAVPTVTLRDTLPGRGHMTMQFERGKTVRVTGSLAFSRWGPSAVREPYLLLSEQEFVGTYRFTTSNTLEMHFPSATGPNAWLNGEWFYDWDGQNVVPFQSRAWMRVVFTPKH